MPPRVPHLAVSPRFGTRRYAGVISARDPFLLADEADTIGTLVDTPELYADVCMICGSVLVTMFVVHWTVCEKLEQVCLCV